MSGGSYDYAYRRIEDLAGEIRLDSGCRSIPGYGSSRAMRAAFADHLRKVAEAMRAIEWNDSGDGDDREQELIAECIGKGGELAFAVSMAKDALDQLNQAIKRAEELT